AYAPFSPEAPRQTLPKRSSRRLGLLQARQRRQPPELPQLPPEYPGIAQARAGFDLRRMRIARCMTRCMTAGEKNFAGPLPYPIRATRRRGERVLRLWNRVDLFGTFRPRASCAYFRRAPGTRIDRTAWRLRAADRARVGGDGNGLARASNR